MRAVVSRNIYLSQPDASEIYARLMDVLKTEGKSFNEWVYEAMKEYVVKHGSGNVAFKLDKWLTEPDFIAMPTLGEIIPMEKFIKYPREIILQIKKNAEYYATSAEYILRQFNEHQRHVEIGYTTPETCLFCKYKSSE